MKQIKIVLIVLSGFVFFMTSGYANGVNERASVNGGVSKEIRHQENVVNNPEMFISDVSGDNKASMSSQSVHNKNKKSTTPDAAAVQVLHDDYNMIGKYNNSSPGMGDKKIKE